MENNIISKELLGEVLGFKNRKTSSIEIEIKGSVVGYNSYNKDGTDYISTKTINIHELAHKCKEWAIKKGFDILSGGMESDEYSCYLDSDDDKCRHKYKLDIYDCISDTLSYYAQTEHEAIFKACQWILENKN